MSEIVQKGPYAPDAAGDEALRRYGREREAEVLLDRELGESLAGLDIHKNALEILDWRGKADNYTDAEYVDACMKAGAR